MGLHCNLCSDNLCPQPAKGRLQHLREVDSKPLCLLDDKIPVAERLLGLWQWIGLCECQGVPQRHDGLRPGEGVVVTLFLLQLVLSRSFTAWIWRFLGVCLPLLGTLQCSKVSVALQV